MWSSAVIVCLFAVTSIHAYSKYGRTCKDIGCLNSEVCVMAEDPCSYGRTSDCGSYPTCKKKSAVDGGGGVNNAPVTKPTTPKPIAELKPQPQPSPPKYDDVPNYPPPPPPRNPPYGGSNYGGGGSNYGGGGSNYGGGGSNYGGGSSNPSGSNGGGFGGFDFGSVFGGGNSNDKNGNPLTSILSNIFNNLTKNGFPNLNPSFTRPTVDNRNSNPNPYGGGGGGGGGQYPNNYPSNGYPGYNNNPYQQRPGGYYPSYSQPTNNQAQSNSQPNGYIAKNYGQNQAVRNSATTNRPTYGWTHGCSLVLIPIFNYVTKYF